MRVFDICLIISIGFLLITVCALSYEVESLASKITVLEESISFHNTRLNNIEQRHALIHKPLKKEK
jgi:hypothetical protein